MPKKTKKQEFIYTYEEVLQSIEDGINIWDFAIKFGILNFEKHKVKTLLNQCTNSDEEKSNYFFEKICENSRSYTEKHPNKDFNLNTSTLFLLLKKGLSKTEMMKIYGKTSSASFNSSIENIMKKSGFDKNSIEEFKFELKELSKSFKVKIVPNQILDTTVNEINTSSEITNDSSELLSESSTSDCDNIENTLDAKNETFNASKSTEKNNARPGKIIIYTYEYLVKQADLLDVIFDNNYDECSFEDEHILLSCTLNKFMSKTSVDSTAKMKLTESLNSEKVRVLMANSNYQNATKKHVDISLENEVALSQGLMLSYYTDKKIFIATCEPKTALNAMTFGFGIRIPKNRILDDFSDITDENLDSIVDFFDFELPYEKVTSHTHNQDTAIILDTCVILKKITHVGKILSDTKQLKILTRIVLDELRECKIFFSTLFAVKCNPSIVIDLNTHLVYNYNDIAILNYAMHYKKVTKKEVIILTHDWQFSVEALSYNIKTKYYPSTYMSTFECDENSDYTEDLDEFEENNEPLEEDELCNTEITDKDTTNEFENDEELEEIIYHRTIPIQKVSSKPVILNNTKISGIKSSKTMEPISMKGHKAYKYYPVELGDFVTLKGDPNLYKIIALSGKDNLESVSLLS